VWKERIGIIDGIYIKRLNVIKHRNECLHHNHETGLMDNIVHE
jgi:hypothetical protein